MNNFNEQESFSKNYQATFIAYLQAYENLTIDSLHNELKPLLDNKIEFKDPFNHVDSKAETIAIFEHMFATVYQPKFTVEYSQIEGRTGYARWSFEFKTDNSASNTKSIKGVSEITISDNLKVCQHIDYWDSAEYIYQDIPILGWFIRLIAKKLSAT